jgi:hypothetical protein
MGWVKSTWRGLVPVDEIARVETMALRTNIGGSTSAMLWGEIDE